MHEQVNTLLTLIYSDEKIADLIHLDGGAALSFFYNIERKFSQDLDFTIETEEAFTYTQKMLSKLNTTSLTVDLVVVPSEYCEYELSPLNSIKVSVHTIEDIFAEKICCLIDRNTYRDLWDVHQIINKHRPDLSKAAQLFQKKQELKNSPYPTLQNFADDFYNLANNKNKWSELESSWEIIYNYLKNPAG
jgi:predicted nucleotidyltransferase component of viral defense system